MQRLLTYLSFVRFSHSVFALPFALTGALLAWRTHPFSWSQVVWIAVCMVSARSAAMGFNRLVDARFDALNPRTAMRELPRGALTTKDAILFVLVSSIVFVYAAGRLSTLCLVLSPIALVIVFWYSLAKRHTSYTQLFLALAMAVAPVGGWIAAEIALRYPHRIDHLILVDAAGLASSPSHPDPLFESLNARALRSLLFHDSDSFASELLFPDVDEPGKIGLVARAFSPVLWSRDLNTQRLERHLSRIANPTLIIWGANDALYPAQTAERFRECIANSSIHLIEKCGHLPMFEQESRFVNAVTRFLNTQ